MDDESVKLTDDRVVHGADRSVVLPKGAQEVSWRDAETNTEHRAVQVGPDAVCICGWTGEGWTQHFVKEARRK